MTYTRKNTSDTHVSFSVTLDSADLGEARVRTLHKLTHDLKLPGFRPGKVPPAVAEKHLDANLLNNEIAEDAINQHLIAVLTAEKIRPLDQPKVSLGKYVPGDRLEFTAELDILPTVKLGNYKALKAKRQAVDVIDTEVDEVVERMQRSMAEKKPVERPAETHDEVIIDFTGMRDGKEVSGATGKDFPLTLGSHSFIPGFEEGLVGKKRGDSFDLPLTFPKDYHSADIAGANVTFAITVKAVHAIGLPELTDDFAAKCGPFKTVDELRADIRRELTTQKEYEALEKLKDELVDKLIDGSDIPTPDVLIADQVASLERDFVQNLQGRGQDLAQYLEQRKLTEEEWQQKDLREQAIRRVKIGLALAELSQIEHISATNDEIEQRLTAMLQYYGSAPDLKRQLDTPEARRDIANRLVTEKTLDRLVDLNTPRKW